MIQHPTITRIRRTGYPEPEPEVVGICEGCGEDIYEGDDIYDFNGAMIHQVSMCCMEYISNSAISTVAE